MYYTSICSGCWSDATYLSSIVIFYVEVERNILHRESEYTSILIFHRDNGIQDRFIEIFRNGRGVSYIREVCRLVEVIEGWGIIEGWGMMQELPQNKKHNKSHVKYLSFQQTYSRTEKHTWTVIWVELIMLTYRTSRFQSTAANK